MRWCNVSHSRKFACFQRGGCGRLRADADRSPSGHSGWYDGLERTVGPLHSRSVGKRFAGQQDGDCGRQGAPRQGTTIGLNLTDSTDYKTGITCWYQSTKSFYAASVIKVTILGALLRKAQEQNRR